MLYCEIAVDACAAMHAVHLRVAEAMLAVAASLTNAWA